MRTDNRRCKKKRASQRFAHVKVSDALRTTDEKEACVECERVRHLVGYCKKKYLHPRE